MHKKLIPAASEPKVLVSLFSQTDCTISYYLRLSRLRAEAIRMTCEQYTQYYGVTCSILWITHNNAPLLCTISFYLRLSAPISFYHEPKCTESFCLKLRSGNK